MATGVIFPEGAFPAGLFAGFPKYGTLEIDDPPTITKYKGCIELNQIEGTTKKHPIQVLDSLEVPVEELVNPIVYCRVNRGIMNTEEFDISEYDEYFLNYDIQIPHSIQAQPLSAGDTVEVVIADAGVGYGKIIINVIPDHTNFATVAGIDSIKGDGWDGENLVSLNTAIENVTVDTTGLATAIELGVVGSDVTAIKAITDLLTLAAINTEVDTAISDAGIVTKIDTVDTVVDGIATTLATPDNFKADISSLATSAEVAAAVSELKGTGWTDETLKTLMDAIEAISITASIDAEDIVDAIFNTHLDSTTYETNDTNRSFGSIIWKLYRVRNYKV